MCYPIDIVDKMPDIHIVVAAVVLVGWWEGTYVCTKTSNSITILFTYHLVLAQIGIILYKANTHMPAVMDDNNPIAGRTKRGGTGFVATMGCSTWENSTEKGKVNCGGTGGTEQNQAQKNHLFRAKSSAKPGKF